jgi:hypothetical protein
MNANPTQQELEKQELTARLSLIETMVAEGRQKTESWGWTFVLWGAAYIGAIVFANLGSPLAYWSTWGHRNLAWPISTISALALMYFYIWFAGEKTERQPDTTIGRAIFSIWIAMGISMFLLLTALGIGGKLDQQVFVSVVGAMLGTTNAASSMILKWRLQFACAVVWWVTAVAAPLVTVSQSTIIFIAAIFVCQIVFGVYGMISESRQIRQSRESTSGAAHA